MDLKSLYDKISDKNEIVVTHIINPNKFYIKFSNNKKDVELIELELDRLYKHDIQNMVQPKRGDMVAFHHPVWNKHIRVIVDKVDKYNCKLSFFLWAVDYGIPLFTQSTCFFKVLPLKYSSRTSDIVEASLQILPANYQCDLLTKTSSLVRCRKWIDTAVSIFRKYIQDATEIKFYLYKNKNDKLIGDILLQDYVGKVFSMEQILLGKYAVKFGDINEFIEKVSLTDTVHLERWDDNERRGALLDNPLKEYTEGNYRERQLREKKPVHMPSVENWKVSPSCEELYSSTGTDIENLVDKISLISDRDYATNIHDTKNDVKIHSDSPTYVSNFISTSATQRISTGNPKPNNRDNHSPKTKLQTPKAGSMKTKQKELVQTSPYDNAYGFDSPAPVKESPSTSNSSIKISVLKDRLEQRKQVADNKKPGEEKVAPKTVMIPIGANYDDQIINPIKRNIAPKMSNNNNNNNGKRGYFTQSNRGPQLVYDNIAESRPSFSDSANTSMSTNNNPVYEAFKTLVPDIATLKLFEASTKPAQKSSRKSKIAGDARIANAKTMRKVLIKGTCAGPVEKRAEANFSQSVDNYMNRYMFKTPLRIQQYAWPNVLECNSFVAVGRSRKTFSYLPGICSIIEQKELSVKGKDQTTLGPIGIIVVKSAADVVYIGKICQQMFPHNNIDIVTGYGSKNIAEVIGRLLNGCHIFITTPRFFTRLLKEKCQIIDRKRVEHLVFDDYDQMLENFKSDVDTILTACCYTNNLEDNPQLIITASVWYQHMESLIHKYAINPFLLFADYLEAAVFVKSDFKLQVFTDSSEKSVAVSDYLKDNRYTCEKTILIANTDEEVREISSHLYVRTVVFINLLEEARANVGLRIKQWNDNTKIGEFQLLIISNEMLKKVDISMAQHIIHYSLPSTFDSFSDRYECSLGFFHKCLENPKYKGSSLIFLDDENNIELPRLIEFWKCHGNTELPPAVNRLVEKAMIEKEKSSTGLVCPRIFDFGDCILRKNCNGFRHAFNHNDKPLDTLPAGMIKFNVTEVHSLKKFTIKITEIYENEKWIKYDHHNTDFQLNMNIDLNCEENQVNVSALSPGVICVAKSNSGNFDRVVVVNVEKNRISTNLKKTRVFLIDKGKVEDTLSSELFVLPEEYKRRPPTVCELYINGLIPADYDENWDPYALKKLKEIVNDHSNKENYDFVCNVDFVIGNIVFTNTVSIRESLSTLKLGHICKIDVKNFLLKNNFCAEDRNTLEKLKALAKAAGVLKMTVTKLEIVEEPSQNTPKIPEKSKAIATAKPKTITIANKSRVQPRHKWIEIDLNKTYQVYITNFNDPENIFVQIFKNGDDWVKLKTAMREVIKRKLPESEIEVGKYCMIENEHKWARVMITGKHREKVKCFFVDSGYTDWYFSDELYELPDNILKILDFQAIHCRLVGQKNWQDQYNSDFNHLLNSYEFIYIKPVKKYEYYSKWERYNYYGVVMVGEDEEMVKLNQYIIDENLAEEDPETINYVNEDFKLPDDASDEVSDDEASGDEADSSNGPVDISNDNDFECNFDDGLMNQLGFRPEMFGLQSFDQLKNEGNLQIAQSTENKSKKTTDKDITVNKEWQQSQLPDIPLLHSIYRPSKMQWMQNVSMVKLVFEALDCLDYTFEVCTGHLLLIIKFADHHEVTFLKFFGKIEPSLTSHEMAGLQIVIRLAKLFQTSEMWPRLLDQNERNNFIKYNMSYINVKDEVNLTDNLKRKIVRFDDLREPTYSDGDHNAASDDDDDDVDDDDDDDDVYNPLS